MKKMLFFYFFSFCSSCSVAPDSEGNCSLSCDSATIAPYNYKATALSTAVKVNCNGVASGTAMPVSLAVSFSRPLPQAAGVTAADVQLIPISGISYEITTTTGMNGENPDDPASKFRGITTSKSEWCTDSCGVGTFEVTPTCQAKGYTSTVMIRSGSVVTNIDIDMHVDQ